jgi:two-component system phosphate regulon sensor histidine kinase PhoR
MVLHEIRTPLASLTVTVELLLDNFGQLREPEVLSLLQRVQRSTVWLQSLIENLSVAAQLETSQLQLRWSVVELSDCLDTALLIVQPSLDRERQRVNVTDVTGRRVAGDPRRIEQVLVNLLINASKYGGPGTDIQVKAEPLANSVRIWIQDEGPGVEASEHERIFVRYVRGTAAEQNGSGGLGLGLHIVKTLVELHGGAVGVESASGQGARFWFTLPWVEGEEEDQ